MTYDIYIYSSQGKARAFGISSFYLILSCYFWFLKLVHLQTRLVTYK